MNSSKIQLVILVCILQLALAAPYGGIGDKSFVNGSMITGANSTGEPNASSLPVVDLGYAKYRATFYDQKHDIFVFKVSAC